MSSHDRYAPPPLRPGEVEGSQLFRFLVDDFSAAWDALVTTTESFDAGGNFAFAAMSTVLIELCCRVAQSNATAYAHFAERLEEEEPRYFSELPFSVKRGKRSAKEFALPRSQRYADRPADRQLIAAVFDLLRNGLVHQYQQIVARTADGKTFGLSLTGVDPRNRPPRYRDLLRGPGKPPGHLDIVPTPKGHLWLILRPEILFRHVEVAALRSSLFSGTLHHRHLRRNYQVTVADIRSALESAGHPTRPWQ